MPAKTLYTPVFYPPNPSLSSLSAPSNSQQPSVPPQAYLDYLSRTHVALSQVSRELDESGLDVEEYSQETQERISSLRNQILQIYTESKGNPCSGRWTKIPQLLRLSCTAGGARWLGVNTQESQEPKTGENGKTVRELTGKWLNANTEEEWAKWEKMREKTVGTTEKVKQWLSSPKNEKKQQALSFNVVKRASVNAKPKPRREEEEEEIPSSSNPKVIQDVSEADFYPPSFPSHLQTSTPHGNRHRPPSIQPAESESPLYGHARDLSIPLSSDPEGATSSREKILVEKANSKRTREDDTPPQRVAKHPRLEQEDDEEPIPTLTEILAAGGLHIRRGSVKKKKTPARQKTPTLIQKRTEAGVQLTKSIGSVGAVPNSKSAKAETSVQTAKSIRSSSVTTPSALNDPIDPMGPTFDPLYASLLDRVPKDAPNPGGYPTPGSKANLEMDDLHLTLIDQDEVASQDGGKAKSFSSIAEDDSSSSSTEQDDAAEEFDVPDFTAHPELFDPPFTSTQRPPIPNMSPLKGMRRLSSIAQTQTETQSPTKRSPTKLKRGMSGIPGSLGAFGGLAYNSQIDVEGRVGEVDKFLEEDLELITEEEEEDRMSG